MTTRRETGKSNWQVPVMFLAFGTFAVGTDAFVVSGVLPQIAGSLDVSIAAAAQLVTVFSLAYALSVVPLAVLTATWPRRRVFATALALFAVGNIATVVAPAYPLVLVARVVAAAGAALYTATATATAATLAGARHQGRAIAGVLFGLTAALVLGSPLGTALGSTLGWRTTLWCVAGLGASAGLLLASVIPAGRTPDAPGLRRRLRPLAERHVQVLLARTVVIFTAIYLPYTYISVMTAPSTSGDGGSLALLLLVFGVAATFGNLAAGRLTDRRGPQVVLLAGTVVLVGVFVGLAVARDSFIGTVALVAAFGAVSFCLNAPQQHQIIESTNEEQSIATALHQSALYVAVSASGVLGAAGLAVFGARALPLIAACLALTAAALTWHLARTPASKRVRQQPFASQPRP